MGTSTPTLIDDARKLRLLQWLTTPEQVRADEGWPKSLNKLAEEIGVSPRTLRDWRADPSFRAAWEKEAKDIIGDPEKVQTLLQEIYNGALDHDETLASRVRAAELYLKTVDALKPPKVDQAKRAVAEYSDAELNALIAEAAVAEQKQRIA